MSESLRVLVVEDAEDGKRELAAMLTAAGFLTRQATDDAEALVHLDAWQPAAVVVDLRVQQRAGRRFCAALAQRPDGQDRPVVFVGEAPNLMKRFPLAPAGLVSTPFEDEQLTGAVRRVATGRVRELAAVN